MKVDIWSDVVCPFCYIGKRKFENALVEFSGKDEVEIVWHSFQLDPDLIPVAGKSVSQWLADRKGVSDEEGKKMNDSMAGTALKVGLVYDFDKAIVRNTLTAHRLLHLSKEYGVQNEMKERLFRAYYTEGKDIDDLETLVLLGEEIKIPGEIIRTVLGAGKYTAEVLADQQRAQEIGIQGVPFFVFNDKYAVSGAQPTHLFKEVLDKVYEEEHPLKLTGEDGAGFCTPEGVCE